MTGHTPNFDDWRMRDALSVYEIACLMNGFDPRAMTDAVVRDPDNPTSPYGMPLDTSWDENLLRSAVREGELLSAPRGVLEPTANTEISRRSLLTWLRASKKYDVLVDGLTRPEHEPLGVKKMAPLHSLSASNGVPDGEPIAPGQPAGQPIFSLTRQALISLHEHHWPTIAADISDAGGNGLSAAKAGKRDWVEATALAWARSKGKLKIAEMPAVALTQAMHTMANLPGRKHTTDD